jgi:hypothetical protein
MANLRIVYDNAASRAASLVASSEVGNLLASNLLSDLKSEVWRTSSTSGTLTLTWSSSEVVGVVSLPFSSLTTTATIRVRAYTSASDPTPAYDSGAVLASPLPFGSFYWGLAPLNVNSYAYGGGMNATLWFNPIPVQKLVIDLVDTNNTNGFIEAGKIVVGAYWEPTVNCQYGAQVTPMDMTTNTRTDAGDLRSNRGPQYKKLSFSLAYLPKTDRDMAWRILRGNGMFKPVFVSLLPGSTDDTVGEQLFSVYGKLSQMSDIKFTFANQFDTQIEIEEI